MTKSTCIRNNFCRLDYSKDSFLIFFLQIKIEDGEDSAEQGGKNDKIVTEAERNSDFSAQMARHGIPSHSYAFEVTVDHSVAPTSVNEDNAVLFDTVREHARVIQRWITDEAMSWEATLSHLDAHDLKLRRDQVSRLVRESFVSFLVVSSFVHTASSCFFG